MLPFRKQVKNLLKKINQTLVLEFDFLVQDGDFFHFVTAHQPKHYLSKQHQGHAAAHYPNYELQGDF